MGIRHIKIKHRKQREELLSSRGQQTPDKTKIKAWSIVFTTIFFFFSGNCIINAKMQNDQLSNHSFGGRAMGRVGWKVLDTIKPLYHQFVPVATFGITMKKIPCWIMKKHYERGTHETNNYSFYYEFSIYGGFTLVKIYPEPIKVNFVFMMSLQYKVYGPSGNTHLVPVRETLMCMCSGPHNQLGSKPGS